MDNNYINVNSSENNKSNNVGNEKNQAFNSNNLVESFCNPPENNGVAFELVETLFSILKDNMCRKTEMLFLEWKQLFNLAHDDVSKQQAIIGAKI